MQKGKPNSSEMLQKQMSYHRRQYPENIQKYSSVTTWNQLIEYDSSLLKLPSKEPNQNEVIDERTSLSLNI